MNKRYIVTLTDEEREALQAMGRSGRVDARALRHSRMLLEVDEPSGATDEQVAEDFGVVPRTVARLRQRFVEDGLEATIRPPRRPRMPRKVDGRVEAHLVALACSTPPQGRARWSLRLLADTLVELGHVGSMSHEGVRDALKKTRSSPGGSGAGASRRTTPPSS